MATVGIIGGSGLYNVEEMQDIEEHSLFTPFGQPSSNFVAGTLNGCKVVFLPRHGKGHSISPSEVNYRANVFGMKKLGVDAIISVSACGSLKEEIKPMDFVVPDQFVDFTKGYRAHSFFTDGIVAHVSLAEPFSEEIRKILLECLAELNINHHKKGTYINIEGPQFSSKAESSLFRSWGMDIIGMTNATEAKLAREAEISYVSLSSVTDYDCWFEGEEAVTVDIILDNLNKNVENARKIIKAAIPKVASLEQFSAAGALASAIVTAKDVIPENKKKELEFL